MAVILFICIIFPCHCAVYMYKIMILQKPQPISPKFCIDPTVVMIGLEKCCITSAYLQWLCHSGERAVARGPLVSFFVSNGWPFKQATCPILGILVYLLLFFRENKS